LQTLQYVCIIQCKHLGIFEDQPYFGSVIKSAVAGLENITFCLRVEHTFYQTSQAHCIEFKKLDFITIFQISIPAQGVTIKSGVLSAPSVIE